MELLVWLVPAVIAVACIYGLTREKDSEGD